MSDFVNQNKTLATNFSKESGWVVLSEIETRIKQKIEAIGTPLKNWDVQINYGIKTGFNDAFIIDGQKRAELLENCPKAAEIIRPILRGRDIKPYSVEFADKWIINSHNGTRGLSRIVIENDYPEIFSYFDEFREQLEKRQDKGHHWTNLRNCAYLEEFNKEKIIWIELSDTPKFSYDEENYFVEATAFFMTGSHLKFLTAFLNSKLCDWYFDKITTTSGAGTNRWKKIYIENFPIPEVSSNIETQFNNQIEEILKRKQQNQGITSVDSEINDMVLSLYDFSPEELDTILKFREVTV